MTEARRILITGGAGCLGAGLVERFVPRGEHVLVVDNFATGKREVLPEVAGLTTVEGSVADRDLVARCASDFAPDVVIHAAASYRDPQDWREDVASNVVGTVNVVDAATDVGVERLIFLQTALCYGRPEVLPVPRDHPLRPFTSYGISKTAGEAYVSLGRVPWVSLRLANVIGPRLAIGPIPAFYKRLSAGQPCFCTDAQRDFLDMEDFLDVVDRALDPDVPSGAFNVSTGEAHSIREVFDAVAAHLGITTPGKVPLVPPGDDDIAGMVLDPRDTHAILGWRARVDFDETLSRVLAWYDEHGVTDVYSHLKPPALGGE